MPLPTMGKGIFYTLTDMVLLEKRDYGKAMAALKAVQINNLFARAVVELHVDGELYADEQANPTSFFAIHPYGMGLLFGDASNACFNESLVDYVVNKKQKRSKDLWLQAWPDHWHSLWKQLLEREDVKERTDEFVRVNFEFDESVFLANRVTLEDPRVVLQETDGELFERMKGSVVPSSFWNDAQDFVLKGKGFSLVCGSEVAATAYSAFVIDNLLEIGIETVNGYRARGYAKEVCTALIDYALRQGLVPVWGCKRDNYASYQLAQKLGFRPTLEIPYYRLKV